jgi:hypothetical protein
VVEVEADDPVERGQRFGLEGLEHAGVDPLVATSAQGRVRHPVLEDRFDVGPRRAGHEPDDDPSEAQPVRHPRSVTAQRMGPIRRREQGSDRCPDGIDHLSLERAHDVGYLQRVVFALAYSVTADAARNATPSQ